MFKALFVIVAFYFCFSYSTVSLWNTRSSSSLISPSSQRFEHCSKDELIFFEPDLPENNYDNIVNLGLKLQVMQKIHGPIDASFEISRCSLDLKSCQQFGNFNLRNCCQRLTNSTLIISKIVSKINPPVRCPIDAGNYTAERTELNFKLFSYLPFDGWIYNVIVKVVSTNPKTKSRIIASCFKTEIKIVKVRI
jgi:hypothetical protein